MVSLWRNLGKGVQILAVALVVVIGGGLLLLWLTGFFGQRANEVNNNLYNNSPTHVQAVAQELTSACAQLGQTTDPTARAGIDDEIAEDLANTKWSLVQQLLFPTTVTCVNNAMAIETGQNP